jgi:multiple sugar transport system permease protein
VTARSKRHLEAVALNAAAVLILAIFLAPLVWAFLISIRPQEYILSFPPRLWAPPSLEHYRKIFETIPFLSYLSNSAVSVVTATLISVVVGSAAGYGLARMRFRGKKDLLFWILSLRILPPAAVIVPFYILFSQFGLLQSKVGLVLAYTLLTLPLSIWLMRSFFLAVPKSLEDAARIDGCSELGLLLRISLPLAAGGILVTMVFCFIFAWNDYVFALVLTSSRNHTVTVGMSRLITTDRIDWGMLLAGAFIAAAPIILLTIVAQRYILRGLTFGFFEQKG